MYSIDGLELGMTCIVFTLYIVGKVWMYYRIDKEPNKPKGIRIKSGRKSKSKKGVIRRGTEWDE
jgi:hypothetical protein